MKRTFIYTLAALSALLCGCERELDNQIPVVESEYLVIEAQAPATKTDVTEGVTSWEAGDQITVVYDGNSYTYTASSAGTTTTFTSTAGITNYDASKSCIAYYPAVSEAGVEVPSATTLVFQSGTQENSSKAPLVGTPNTGNLSDGKLGMVFENVFSVLEIRVDAGELSSPAKTLVIEPADPSDFTGYLAGKGTVDADTREVTTSSTSNQITLTFPSNTSLTSAMTIKVPVGRFTTESGLKLTITTNDDKTYSKTVYKTGLTTFKKSSGGVYSAIHFVKPVYAFAAPGGISTVQDLLDFATAVNSGAAYTDWMNSEGKVVLLNDLDMSSVTSWTPIGDVVISWASNVLTVNSGNAFNGYFDGQGYKIKNLALKTTNSTAGKPFGLFGMLGENAVVENLVIDSSCSFEVASTVSNDCGVIAGVAEDAIVRNITNNAPMSFTGTSTARVTMAVVGFANAKNVGVTIENVINNGAISAVDGGSSQNGAAAIQVAGILGFGTNDASSSKIVEVKSCTNNGNIESATARTSGIVAASNRYTVIRSCENYGNNKNTFSKKNDANGGSACRIGNITCILGAGSAIYDTTNHGDVISVNSGAVAGIVSLVNDVSNVLENVKNYGRIITDRTACAYCGLFFGSCNKAATFTNCIAGGSFGTYNDGDYDITPITADNYWSYVGQVGSSATNATQENIKFGTAPTN